jgi:hypothetical protein
MSLANLVSQEVDLRGIGSIFDGENAYTLANAEDIGQAGFEVWRKFLDQHFAPIEFPQLYEYLGPIRADLIQRISDRYSLLCGARALLAAVADSPGRDIQVPVEAATYVTALVKGQDGRIQLEPDGLLKCIEGVEAARIRRCSECKRIFWAGRLDKFACARKCVVRRRVRLWRERYPERYKLRRVRRADAAESRGVKPNDTKRRES